MDLSFICFDSGPWSLIRSFSTLLGIGDVAAELRDFLSGTVDAPHDFPEIPTPRQHPKTHAGCLPGTFCYRPVLCRMEGSLQATRGWWAKQAVERVGRLADGQHRLHASSGRSTNSGQNIITRTQNQVAMINARRINAGS